jgi:hypothetical protein
METADRAEEWARLHHSKFSHQKTLMQPGRHDRGTILPRLAFSVKRRLRCAFYLSLWSRPCSSSLQLATRRTKDWLTARWGQIRGRPCRPPLRRRNHALPAGRKVTGLAPERRKNTPASLALSQVVKSSTETHRSRSNGAAWALPSSTATASRSTSTRGELCGSQLTGFQVRSDAGQEDRGARSVRALPTCLPWARRPLIFKKPSRCNT